MVDPNPNIPVGISDPNPNVQEGMAHPNPNPNPNPTKSILKTLVDPVTPDARAWALTLTLTPYLHT
jgi:hypothetical protein